MSKREAASSSDVSPKRRSPRKKASSHIERRRISDKLANGKELLWHDELQRPNLLVSLWFVVSSLVVIWDLGYCFARPHSMTGGKWEWLWRPYILYATIDYTYGLPALKARDGFTNAQAFLNIVESLLNFAYVYHAHILHSPSAVLLGFTSVTMTFSKTLLYHLREHYSGWANVGHNDWNTFIWLWVVPNGLWLVIPGLLLLGFGRQIKRALDLAAEEKKLS